MHRIGLVISDGVQVLSLAPIAVFEMANLAVDQPFYDLCLLSEHGEPVRSSVGVTMTTARLDSGDFETVIFGAATRIQATSPAVLNFARQALSASRRVAAPCTGAFVLAEAGILDGRRATTHWLFARELQARYPKIKVEEDRIFIVDGPVWTSAGMSAGIDLALAMIEQDLGAAIARSVAKTMVVYHRRTGGQSQFSALLDLAPKSDRIQSALAYARRNLQRPLSVQQLAHAVHLSPRQFSRAFRAETGQSPAKAVQNLRVEAARLLMEQGRLAIDVVARESGFAGRERMRRAFLRAFGQPPQVIRRNANAAAGVQILPLQRGS